MSKAAELAALIANVNKGSSLGNKNLVINGAMNVAQRGTSESSITSSKYAACDRWKMNGNNGTWTASQDTNAPDGFSNSYKFVLTATETIGSTSYMEIEQRMEGQHLQQLSYGTSDAKTITLSFYVKSNITGTYCANLYQDDGSKNYPKTYTINSANTWEYKTLSFVGDTSTALDNDNASSLRTTFFMVAGSGHTSGSAGSRVAYANATYAAGHSAQIDAVNDYFQITGVQLEIGEKATEFEHEPFETTLRKCQRYYIRRNAAGVYHYFGSGHVEAVNAGRIYTSFPVEMNHIPVLETSGTASDYACYNSDVDACTSVPNLTNASTFETGIQLANSSNAFTAGRGCNLLANNTTDAFLAFESEL